MAPAAHRTVAKAAVRPAAALAIALFVSDWMQEDLAYQIAKTVFERRDALIAVHQEAEQIAVANQTRRLSPIPFHPGAVRYLRERGVSPE